MTVTNTITLAAVLNLKCDDVRNTLRIGASHDLAERLYYDHNIDVSIARCE